MTSVQSNLANGCIAKFYADVHVASVAASFVGRVCVLASHRLSIVGSGYFAAVTNDCESELSIICGFSASSPPPSPSVPGFCGSVCVAASCRHVAACVEVSWVEEGVWVWMVVSQTFSSSFPSTCSH